MTDPHTEQRRVVVNDRRRIDPETGAPRVPNPDAAQWTTIASSTASPPTKSAPPAYSPVSSRTRRQIRCSAGSLSPR